VRRSARGPPANPAPYARIAYEWNWPGNPRISGPWRCIPTLTRPNGDRSADTTFGRDSYTDVAIDGGYQFLGDGKHTATIDAILTHEEQNLKASTGSGASTSPGNHLNQARLNMAYFYQQTYGLNLGWQYTLG